MMAKPRVDEVSQLDFALEVQVQAVGGAPKLLTTFLFHSNLESCPVERELKIGRLLNQPKC